MTTSPNNIIWIDCEFTGLDYTVNRLIEIAVVVTDSDLKVLGTPLSFVIHYPQDILESITSEWVKTNLPDLLDEVATSSVSMQDAEGLIMDYLQEFCDEHSCPLAGNSVSADRRMIEKEMPTLGSFLHYRTIDVSTIKELAGRWKPELLMSIDKKQTHRALDDIYESIEELALYRSLWLT